MNDDIDFQFVGTQAHFGCGATFMDQFWYFGGPSYNSRQVCISFL